MADPTIPPAFLDLLESPIPVGLATIGPSGYPQVTAVWVLLEGDNIVTSVTTDRQKAKNLAANPKATFFVIDPANPYRTLEVRGDVTLTPDPELALLSKLCQAYGSTLETFGGPLENRVIVTLHPTRVVTNG